jgi:hypothetical protein
MATVITISSLGRDITSIAELIDELKKQSKSIEQDISTNEKLLEEKVKELQVHLGVPNKDSTVVEPVPNKSLAESDPKKSIAVDKPAPNQVFEVFSNVVHDESVDDASPKVSYSAATSTTNSTSAAESNQASFISVKPKAKANKVTKSNERAVGNINTLAPRDQSQNTLPGDLIKFIKKNIIFPRDGERFATNETTEIENPFWPDNKLTDNQEKQIASIMYSHLGTAGIIIKLQFDEKIIRVYNYSK